MSDGLEIRGLTVRVGGAALLEDASFRAPAGQVTALVGPNGAGKSTLLMAVAGLLPARGEIRFGGMELGGLQARDRARMLALVEQSVDTAERLTGREVVALGRIPHSAVWQGAETEADRAAIAAALLAAGAGDLAGRSYAGLSGGERQKLQIARALAQEPRLLLLDEPTSHLDIRAQLELMALLPDWAAGRSGQEPRRVSGGMPGPAPDQGNVRGRNSGQRPDRPACPGADGIAGQCAGRGRDQRAGQSSAPEPERSVLVVLHDLALAARHCQRLAVLHRGRVVAEGAPAQVLTEDLIRDVWGVDARVSGGSQPEIRFLGPVSAPGPDPR